MNIAVEDLSKVDKKITITANRSDLQPKFDSALKQLRKDVNLPGFRPGQAPMGLLKKRFGTELEAEEAYRFVDEVYQNTIVSEHKPIGQPKFDDINWDTQELTATVSISVQPEFEVKAFEDISVDKMVYDVTEEDVDKELEHAREKTITYSETDKPIQLGFRVFIDTIETDAEGTPTENTEIERDVEIKISEDTSDEPTQKALIGHQVGDDVRVKYEQDGKNYFYTATVKKVEEGSTPEINDDWVKKETDNEMETVDEYRARVKSQVQSYYDNASDRMARNMLIDAMVGAHEFEVPELLLETVKKDSLEKTNQQNAQQGRPALNLDDEEVVKSLDDASRNNIKWMFIVSKLREDFKEELEIKREDIDAFYERKAAELSFPVELLKQYYGENPELVEQIYNEVLDEKVFNFLLEKISINELEKDDFQKKHNPSNGE